MKRKNLFFNVIVISPVYSYLERESFCLTIFRFHILVLRVYLSRLKYTSLTSIFELRQTKPDLDKQAGRDRVRFDPLAKYCWSNKNYVEVCRITTTILLIR